MTAFEEQLEEFVEKPRPSRTRHVGRVHLRRPHLSQRLEKAASSDPQAVLPVGPYVEKLTEALLNERRDVLNPLLRRLVELGLWLQGGKDVPLELLDEGLALLTRYARTLHAIHIQQFVSAGLSDRQADLCFVPLALIEREPDRAEQRLGVVKSVLDAYRYRPGQSRSRLGICLQNEAVSELSWESYSEQYAASCVPSRLTPQEARDWEQAIVESRAQFGKLKDEVAGFLVKTEPYVPGRFVPGGTREGTLPTATATRTP